MQTSLTALTQVGSRTRTPTNQVIEAGCLARSRRRSAVRYPTLARKARTRSFGIEGLVGGSNVSGR